MIRIIVPALLALAVALPAQAFMEGGCTPGKCAECHSLTLPEAERLLVPAVDKVLKVEAAELPGLWAVEVEKDQKQFPIYLDYSKTFVVNGNIIRLADKKNPAKEGQNRLNKVDVKQIPVEDALRLGRADARTKVIVFTDPECPYCRKLHSELQQVVATDPGISFLIKLFPLAIHPNAYQDAKTILCARSLELLEASFAGKPLPPPLCQTRQVDDNIALAAELGIRGTPTLVLPDGRVLPGYRSAADLLTLLGSSKTLPTGPQVGQKP